MAKSQKIWGANALFSRAHYTLGMWHRYKGNFTFLLLISQISLNFHSLEGNLCTHKSMRQFSSQRIHYGKEDYWLGPDLWENDRLQQHVERWCDYVPTTQRRRLSQLPVSHLLKVITVTAPIVEYHFFWAIGSHLLSLTG